jgi:hypothetical protein
VPAVETLVPRSVWLLALEGRAWLELAAYVPGLPLLAWTARGDGHPVLVLPGLLASDASTRPLRAVLRRQGYHVHGWRLGRNVGANPGVIAGLAARLHADRLAQPEGTWVPFSTWGFGPWRAERLRPG